jgi:hypothetical protein
MFVQSALGLLLYPAYRIEVRAADFDRHAPFVAALFDLKEHLGALSLALVVAAALAGRRPQEGSARISVAALSCTGAALVWAAALLGLYVTGRHPVGMR